MHGLNTIKELNDAATASQEKAAWPQPVAAENTVESAPLPSTPAVSCVEQ